MCMGPESLLNVAADILLSLPILERSKVLDPKADDKLLRTLWMLRFGRNPPDLFEVPVQSGQRRPARE